MLCSLALAQQHTFAGKLLDKPPVIDGVISDEEWSGVPSATGGFDRDTGAPDSFGAQYWLAYDRQFIYVAMKLHDPEPNLIHATEFRSNVNLQGDDYASLLIDPFSTLSDTNQFQINPRGATNVRIAGGRAAKREWLGDFQAKARITKDGWEAEARIPWAILRLPPPGIRDLRISFSRTIQRTNRTYFLDDISSGKWTNLGAWKQVQVPRPEVRRTMKLLPYLYGGGGAGGSIANAGLDLKAPITSELDLIGSVNPDFRNIEKQILSIDFSYFERLAAESRPFFLEGTNYFLTSSDAPLFVSQRISEFDVGGKVYGKFNENSRVGLLDTVSFGRQNNLVGSVQYNFTPKTDAGFSFTDAETPTGSNKGTFVDFDHQIGAFTFFGQHMTTQDTTEGTGHRYNTGFVYIAGGANNDFEYVEISPKFLPRLGFAPERDLKGFLDILDFSHPTHWGKVVEVGAGFGFNDLRTFEHTLYRRAVNASGSLSFKDGEQISASAYYQEFEGFKDRYAMVTLTRSRNDLNRNASVTLVGGRIAGESYSSILPSVLYRPWQHVQLAASYQRVQHGGIDEQTIVSANYDINASDSVSGRAVRHGSSTNFYVAYRRTGNRGNEYYLIVGDPNAESFRTSIVIKAVIPLELRF